MNKFIVGLAVATYVAATAAQAADLRMPVKAPVAPPVPVFSWTGCYFGGHAGGGWGRKKVTHAEDSILPAGSSLSVHTSGFLGGAQVGCDYQVTSNWVIGVEGSVSFGNVRGGASTTLGTDSHDLPLGTLDFHAKTDWIASITERIGYSWSTWLLYAKGGVAWAHDKYSGSGSTNQITCELNDGCSITDTIPFGPISATETRVGWTIGAGIEYAFWRNWSAKAEYNFYDFGSRDLTFSNARTTDAVPPSFPLHIDQRIHTAKFGINYRFN